MADIHATAMTDSLEKIPENISHTYLPRYKNLSDRVLNKGLNYFTQGYIHDIKIYEEAASVSVKCRCWRSMRKSEEPHKVQIDICTSSEKITESMCSCKVGLNGHCSHVIGLIRSLRGLKFHNFKCVPAEQSCTSIPQQWNVPRTDKVKPVSLNNVVVARPTEDRKRKPIECRIDVNFKIPRLTKLDVENLSQINGTPFERNLSVSRDVPMKNTVFGSVPLGSLLSYQTANNKMEPIPTRNNYTGCGDTSVNRTPHVTLPEEFKVLYKTFMVENPSKLEFDTRSLADSTVWHNAREKRVTVSTFPDIIKRKKEPNDKFLSRIFSTRNVYAKSLEYGRRNERKAKAKYLAKYSDRHLHECGL